MATVSDPYSIGSNWSGSPTADTLIYTGGSEIIDGLGGYDTLVLPFAKLDCITGLYGSGAISFSLPPRNTYLPRQIVTAANVEQVQFSDQLVSLASPQNYTTVNIVADRYSIGSNWSGTATNESLIYAGGSEVIDGMGGYDTLVLPFAKADVVAGAYGSGSITLSLPPHNEYLPRDTVTTANIEQIQFTDQLMSLVAAPSENQGLAPAPTESTVQISWTSSGRWVRANQRRPTDGWWFKSGKGKRAKYLVDNDYTNISSLDPATQSLQLSGGEWGNVAYRSLNGGTVLFNGSNVIAYIGGFNSDNFDQVNLVQG